MCPRESQRCLPHPTVTFSSFLGSRRMSSAVLADSQPNPAGIVAAAYTRKVVAGEIDDDPAQYAAISALDSVAEVSCSGDGRGQGLYLHGGVGVGKSLLMDMLFEEAPVKLKRRTHFHAFMLDVHRRLHIHRRVCV